MYPPDSLPKQEFYQWLDMWGKTFGEIKAIAIPWPSRLLKEYAQTRKLELRLCPDLSSTRGIQRAMTFDLDIFSRRELRCMGIRTFDYESELLRLRIQPLPATPNQSIPQHKFWDF